MYPNHPVELGQIRRQRMLDSEATYRVLAMTGDVVEVEVVEAPGLKPGQQFSFTVQAVEAMELVGAAETASRPVSGS